MRPCALTVTFCWSRYLLKYESHAYVMRHISSRSRNFRSSGDLSHVSLPSLFSTYVLA